jgi:hypothetical protein
MSNLIRNERVKLLANWLNTIATGVITVGIFTPLVLRIYEIGEPTKNDSFVNALLVVCIAAALGIHLLGQLLLEALDDDDDE